MKSNPFEATKLLNRTLNFPLNLGDPTEERWSVKLTQQYADEIAVTGFTAVRLAVDWSVHTTQAQPYKVSESTLKMVMNHVHQLTQRGMAVILDMHMYPELMADPEAHKSRFLAIVQQVATYFKHEPASVFLEPLAEPHGKLDKLWNNYFAEALAIIRKEDPVRTVIVGPGAFNNARALPALALPNDDNLIVTIHHYWPLKFTMQGEKWLRLPWWFKLIFGNPSTAKNISWQASPSERKAQDRILDQAATWAKANNRPLFLGEFGTSDNADIASRARWAEYIRKGAEQRSFAWGYWCFGPTFTLYDANKKQWHKEIMQALSLNS